MTEEEKAEKKKLIRIDDFPGTGGGTYSNPTIRFSFVTKSEDARRQATTFFPCRDHMNDALRAHVHGISHGVYSVGNNPPLDMEMMRMLVARDCKNEEEFLSYRERFFSAKRLLNFYEKAAGWKQSRITTVKMVRKSAKHVWLVTGPGEWVSYSQLTSMVTLLFRIIGNYGPIEFTDNASIEKWFEGLIQEYNDNRRSGVFQHDSDISTYLQSAWDKFYMIATRYKDIFTQPLNKAYPVDGQFHGPGGIYHLCTHNTDNKELDFNMKRVYQEYLAQKQKNEESEKVEAALNFKMSKQERL